MPEPPTKKVITIRFPPKRPPPSPTPIEMAKPTPLKVSAFRPRVVYCPCSICIGFIYDYICLPPEVNTFYKLKRLRSCAGELAKTLHRILGTLHSLDIYVVKNTVTMRMDAERRIGSKPDEVLEVGSKALVQAILNRKGAEEIDHLKTTLEEARVFRLAAQAYLWIEITLFNLWNHLPDVHLEHMGQKQSCSAPPALGLRSFYPVSTVSTPTKPPPPPSDLSDFGFEDIYL